MKWDELFSHVVDYDPAAAEKPALPTGGGVYLLTDEQDRLIQLASAADLKRAILNRLVPAAAAQEAASKPDEANGATSGEQPSVSESVPASIAAPGAPVSKRRADLSQIVRRIRWQPAHSVFEITYEYLRIARIALPDKYLKSIAFGPAWFVQVDPAAEIPRFTTGKIVLSGPGATLGPFATQQDANRFVQILEDAFDLCRYIHILEQAPHGQPCAYYEKGRCPAPCGGLIPMSKYREAIQAALTFAAGERGPARAAWESQMHQAANELAFERAAAIKQRLERARELDHPAFRFVQPIEAFSWLIVQRGPGRTRVKPFFVHGGFLQAGQTARLKQLVEVVPEWINTVRGGAPAVQDEVPSVVHPSIVRSEMIWLVSHFLFRRERAGLFFDAARLPGPAELAEAVRGHFTVSRPGPGA